MLDCKLSERKDFVYLGDAVPVAPNAIAALGKLHAVITSAAVVISKQ